MLSRGKAQPCCEIAPLGKVLRRRCQRRERRCNQRANPRYSHEPTRNRIFPSTAGDLGVERRGQYAEQRRGVRRFSCQRVL